MRFFRLFLCLFLLFSVHQNVHAQASRTWQNMAPMPTARTGVSAVEMDGMVYVMGGIDENDNILDVVEIYNPETDSWNIGPNLRTARYNFAAVVYNDQIFVMGGHDNDDESSKKVEVFSPSMNRWDSFDNLAEEREGLGAVVLDDKLLVMGGANGSGDILSSVEILDTDEMEWERYSEWELDVPRALFGYVSIEEVGYSVGGFTSFGPTGLVQAYEEDAGSRNLSAISPGRGGLVAVYFDDSMYAIGGRRSDNLVVNSVDRFYPEENRWEQAPSMNKERERFAAVAVDDKILVFGGSSNGGEVLNSTEALTMSIAPLVQNDILVTDEDIDMSINVLVNDTDPAGGQLSISGFSQPLHGAVTQLDASTFNYQPDRDFFGSDRFTYTALNETGGAAQAIVEITVRPVNDAPVFLSVPVTGGSQDSLYSYVVTVADIDNDPVTMDVTTLPGWLALSSLQNNTALLEGIPGSADLGEHEVVLTLLDGVETVEQRFVITVVEGMPGQAELLSPINGALDVSRSVTVSWNVAGAVTYDVQVALDAGFSVIVVEESGISQAFLELVNLDGNTSFFWRVRGINAAGTGNWADPFEFTTVIDTANEDEVPAQSFRLFANYPNPFRVQTSIPFELVDAAFVELHIYDIHGRQVMTFEEGVLNPGYYTIHWNGDDLSGQSVASGSYFVRLIQGANQVTRMITLIR